MAAHTIQFVHRFSYCCQNSNHQTAPKLMAFLVTMHFHVIIQHYFLLSKQQHYWLVAYRNCLCFAQVNTELLTFYLRDLASHNPLAKRVTLLLQVHLNQVYCMVFFGDICLWNQLLQVTTLQATHVFLLKPTLQIAYPGSLFVYAPHMVSYPSWIHNQ